MFRALTRSNTQSSGRRLDPHGDCFNRVQRKKIIGNLSQFPTISDAKRQVENLREMINAQQGRPGKTTVGDAWGHFQLHELGEDAQVERSPTTIYRYEQLFKVNILPHWKDVALEDVKAVQVEKWLKSLPYPYVHRPTPSAPVPRGPVRSHTLQTEIVKAPVVAAGHSSVSADHFGWLAFIARPLYLALQFLHGHGVGNWGWDIIVLTAMFNMVAVRPRILSMKSSLKMMPIQPKVDAIKQR